MKETLLVWKFYSRCCSDHKYWQYAAHCLGVWGLNKIWISYCLLIAAACCYRNHICRESSLFYFKRSVWDAVIVALFPQKKKNRNSCMAQLPGSHTPCTLSMVVSIANITGSSLAVDLHKEALTQRVWTLQFCDLLSPCHVIEGNSARPLCLPCWLYCIWISVTHLLPAGTTDSQSASTRHQRIHFLNFDFFRVEFCKFTGHSSAEGKSS